MDIQAQLGHICLDQVAVSVPVLYAATKVGLSSVFPEKLLFHVGLSH